MRSRRSVILARLVDSGGPAFLAAEFGAGHRLASGPRLRSGHGRRCDGALFRVAAGGCAWASAGPSGRCRARPRDRSSGDEAASSAAAGSIATSSRPFLRPSSFTVARLLRRAHSAWNPTSIMSCAVVALGPTLACDERFRGASWRRCRRWPGPRPNSACRLCGCWWPRTATATACRRWRPPPPSRPAGPGHVRDDRFMIAPQSDGGPGFVEVLASRLGELRQLRVSGPLDSPVEAQWVFDPGSTTAYLECAQACGLALLGGPPTPETAMAAHSRGVGQLVAEALRAGATRIVVGLGGSACTDGGRGLITELGGLEVARHLLADVELIAAFDVEYPLLGAVGRGQGVRTAEGRGHGHRCEARSSPRSVGARTGRGGRTGRQRGARRGRGRWYRCRTVGAGWPSRVRCGDHRRPHPSWPTTSSSRT